MNTCPCGSQKDFKTCCEPFLLNKKNPKTAEALMRARYTSFVVGNTNFIIQSNVAETREELDPTGLEKWSSESKWLGLQILSTENGTEKDDEGIVEFKCSFEYEGKIQNHHEKSVFKKVDKIWYYQDGTILNGTFRRDTAKVGRNDPCSCGSGKKAKKCCHS